MEPSKIDSNKERALALGTSVCKGLKPLRLVVGVSIIHGLKRLCENHPTSSPFPFSWNEKGRNWLGFQQFRVRLVFHTACEARGNSVRVFEQLARRRSSACV